MNIIYNNLLAPAFNMDLKSVVYDHWQMQKKALSLAQVCKLTLNFTYYNFWYFFCK